MKIAIRTDASEQIGSGHAMRCLTLADDLSSRGAEIFFICADLPGNLTGYIKKRGYMVYSLHYLEQKDNKTEDNHLEFLQSIWELDSEKSCLFIKDLLEGDNSKIDWVILDHYAFDHRWHSKAQLYTEKVMVIDDQANRRYDCDILLDQNNIDKNRYLELVPAKCKLFLGPEYALLRPQFRKIRKNLRKRDGQINRILVFLGGSDHSNETAKALDAIRKLRRPDIAVDVVVGLSNKNKEMIKEMSLIMGNVNYHCQVENMAEMMVKADLVICAGGTTTWERCYVGLPAITITVAENQLHGSKDENLAGSQIYLGKNTQVKSNCIELSS